MIKTYNPIFQKIIHKYIKISIYVLKFFWYGTKGGTVEFSMYIYIQGIEFHGPITT